MPTSNNQGSKRPGAGMDYAMRMREERARQTAKEQPSIGAMIAKIAIGAIFIVVGVFGGGKGFDLAVFLVALIIGLALITWGILGYRQQVKRIEDAKLEVILSTPLEELGNSELHDLTQKYDEADKTAPGQKKG